MRAFSLMETVIALFVLVAGVILSVSLVHQSLKIQGDVRQQVVATEIARNTLARVRDWAAADAGGGVSNFNTSWAIYNGGSFQDPTYPGFTIQVDSRPTPLTIYSPCSTFETVFTPLEKSIERSIVPVEIQVSWSNQRVSILSYVGEPPRSLQSPLNLTITAGSAPLNANDTLTLSVESRDTNGNLVEDLVYEWYVNPIEPGWGLGTLVRTNMPRDGSSIQFQHRVVLRDGTLGQAPGTCRVRVRTVYSGVETWGEIDLVLL